MKNIFKRLSKNQKKIIYTIIVAGVFVGGFSTGFLVFMPKDTDDRIIEDFEGYEVGSKICTSSDDWNVYEDNPSLNSHIIVNDPLESDKCLNWSQYNGFSIYTPDLDGKQYWNLSFDFLFDPSHVDLETDGWQNFVSSFYIQYDWGELISGVSYRYYVLGGVIDHYDFFIGDFWRAIGDGNPSMEWRTFKIGFTEIKCFGTVSPSIGTDVGDGEWDLVDVCYRGINEVWIRDGDEGFFIDNIILSGVYQ